MDRRLVAVPLAVFALAFGGSLVWFSVSGGDAARPVTARAGAPTPAPSGPGRIVLSLWTRSEEPTSAVLARATLDGSDVRPITEGAGPATAVDAAAAVSPDGTTVAFQRAVPASPPRVHLVGIDGRQLRRLTRGAAVELSPAWSPDGRWIAFARRVRGRLDLFMCAPDGSRLTRLTRTADDDEDLPAWSPDGGRIAFTRYRGGVERSPGALWVMDAAGGGERRLFGGRHDHAAPDWSPDGRSLVLIRDGRVAVARADGTTLRLLTLRAGEEKETRPDWSPDGRRIVFSRDPGNVLVMDADGSHVAQVPLDGPGSGAVWAPAP